MWPFFLKQKDYLKSYLIFSRGERRGIRVFSSIITLLIIFRIILPEINISKLETTGILEKEIFNSISFGDSLNKSDDIISVKVDSLFYFDPNTATLDTLIKLGIKPGVANTVLKYRKAGGRFNVKKDLAKIYGLSSTMYNLLEPYIIIKNSKNEIQSMVSVELNSADSGQLDNIPGIASWLAARIIKYRNILGGYTNLQQLKEVYGMNEEIYDRIKVQFLVDTSLVEKIDINFIFKIFKQWDIFNNFTVFYRKIGIINSGRICSLLIIEIGVDV